MRRKPHAEYEKLMQEYIELYTKGMQQKVSALRFDRPSLRRKYLEKKVLILLMSSVV